MLQHALSIKQTFAPVKEVHWEHGSDHSFLNSQSHKQNIYNISSLRIFDESYLAKGTLVTIPNLCTPTFLGPLETMNLKKWDSLCGLFGKVHSIAVL